MVRRQKDDVVNSTEKLGYTHVVFTHTVSSTHKHSLVKESTLKATWIWSHLTDTFHICYRYTYRSTYNYNHSAPLKFMMFWQETTTRSTLESAEQKKQRPNELVDERKGATSIRIRTIRNWSSYKTDCFPYANASSGFGTLKAFPKECSEKRATRVVCWWV